MIQTLLQNLEKAIRQRNPILADRLQPGLAPDRIRRNLKRAGVDGESEPVVSLFAWKNGCRLDSSLTLAQASIFPDSVYIFLNLDMMLGHFRGFRECLAHHPRYSKIVGRYFPIIWDGSNGWLAVDLDLSKKGRVVIIDTETETMLREAFGSFENFLRAALRANERNERMVALQPAKEADG